VRRKARCNGRFSLVCRRSFAGDVVLYILWGCCVAHVERDPQLRGRTRSQQAVPSFFLQVHARCGTDIRPVSPHFLLTSPRLPSPLHGPRSLPIHARSDHSPPPRTTHTRSIHTAPPLPSPLLSQAWRVYPTRRRRSSRPSRPSIRSPRSARRRTS
jgi:hypothetical protein